LVLIPNLISGKPAGIAGELSLTATWSVVIARKTQSKTLRLD
jgi:hypothetical protein